MILRILEIARLYLAITYRSRAMLIFGILLPVLFTWVIGSAIEQPQPGGETRTFGIAVTMQDTGELGPRLVQRLAADPTLHIEKLTRDQALAAVEAEELAAALILPPDFTQQALSGQPFDLEFALNLSEPVEAQVVEQAVRAALAELEAWVSIAATSQEIATRLSLFTLPGSPTEADYAEASLSAAQAALAEAPPAEVNASVAVSGAASDIPDGTGQSSPGILVVFTIFSTLAGAATLLLEREQGTLRRLLVMPIGKPALLSGKLLGIFLAGILQIIILALAGQLLFGVGWGRAPLALAVMVAAFAFCITALGLMMAALVRTYGQLNAITTMVVLPLAGLGGAMWPIEIVPAAMQTLALFVPTGWAMRGFHDILTRGLGLADILPEAGMLMLFGLVFLAVGVWRFRYE